MITNISADDSMVIEKSRWLVHSAATYLRDFEEKHPLETDMMFRFTAMPPTGPQFMCRFEPNDRVTLKYFTRRNPATVDFNSCKGEYNSFQLISLPESLFDPEQKSPHAPAYASIKIPIKNHIADIENFLAIESGLQEPQSTKFEALPHETHYFIEMGTTKTFLGVCDSKKHFEIIHFLEGFIHDRLWFLEKVFSEID